MSKELLAKQDLERIAMQEIRAFPGCEHVTEVEVEYQVDEVHKTNWTIHVFVREGGDMERIQHAINTTRSGCGIDMNCGRNPNTYVAITARGFFMRTVPAWVN
jgi:hypothetical protein